LEAATLKAFSIRVLTELRLDWNNIGARGTIAIAEALKVNAILTKLWLAAWWQLLGRCRGGSGARDAVKDRSGFVLMV
jgi:hypothetical protein